MQYVKTSTIFRAYSLTPSAHRKKGLYIILLVIVNSFLDFFSIAVFIPLIFLIINPLFVSSNEILSNLYNAIGFESTKYFVVFLTIGVLIFVFAKNLVSVWVGHAKIKYAFEIGEHLSSNAIERYTQISFLDFSQVDFTRELNRITNYPFAFANNIIIPITTFISEIFICALFLAGMAYYDYKMLLLLFVILLPAFILYQARKKSLEKINQDLKEKYPALLKSALQVVEGFPEIKTYQKETYFQDKFQSINKALTKSFVKDQVLQAGTIRFTEIIVGLVTCSLIIYTVLAYQNYQQTLLLLSVYTGASFRMIPSANRILHALQQIRMHHYLFEELSPKQSLPSISLEPTRSNISFNNSIDFKNVSFRYPDGPITLQNVSLTIRKGEKIGIVGKSGEGKTSLLLILLRFLKETSGEILVDGNQMPEESSWRKLLGYVPQNPYIVDGTLCENIAFGITIDKIDRAKVIQIIEDLEMDDLVKQLPKGIDSRIGERGAKLSGGQRQRLAIGRALYSEASILLLDEVTNQVHSSAELEIINLLDRLADKKKTIIMVTHRIPRQNFFDCVYRLEKGILFEQVVRS